MAGKKMTAAHKAEFKKALKAHTELFASMIETSYLMGVRHGIEKAYDLGGVDRAHKRQRDAEREERKG